MSSTLQISNIEVKGQEPTPFVGASEVPGDNVMRGANMLLVT